MPGSRWWRWPRFIRHCSPTRRRRDFVVMTALPSLALFGLVMNALLLVEEAGSLASSYPRHMFVLPARTRTLVFWPMVLGVTIVALTWVAVALLVYRPSGIALPVLLPALGLAAFMAWAQAFSWMPLPVPWLRSLIVTFAMSALVAVPLRLAVTSSASTTALACLLAGYIVAAWLFAWAAVTCDRRGLAWVPSRRVPLASAIFDRAVTGRRRRPFASPLAAQEWYDARCHGLMLNGFVRLALFFIWLILMTAGRRHESLQWFSMMLTLLAVVVIVVIAAAGTSLGRFVPVWSTSTVATTFVFTRPLATQRIVAAKYRVAVRSVVTTVLLAGAGAACWVFASGNTDNAPCS